MNTAFLSDQDLMRVQAIMSDFGLSSFDAQIRLWGRGKAIDVNGTLGKQELSCLLEIARFLGERAQDEQDGEPAAGRKAFCSEVEAASFVPYAPLITPVDAAA
jgi:hypothetical protein